MTYAVWATALRANLEQRKPLQGSISVWERAALAVEGLEWVRI